MREFDPCIYKKYPGAFSGAVVGRPWWRYCYPVGNLSQYVRTDGEQVVVGEESELSEYDKITPIPRPDFRTGQIWILVDNGKILSEVTILGFEGDEFYTTSDALSWSCSHPVMARHYPPHPNAFCPKIPLLGYQLLFDPVCPHLAPWSPT